MVVTLTDRAVVQVKEMLAEDSDSDRQCLRLGLQHGGCSGWSYSLGFDQKQSGDTEMVQQGIRIVVDKAAEPLLKGTVIDYEEAALGGGFRIQNPNANVTCGCGSSFRTPDHPGGPQEC